MERMGGPSDDKHDPFRSKSVEWRLYDLLSEVPDPRRAKSVAYPLHEVLFIALSAMLSGAEAYTEFEEFGHMRREWLEKYLELKNGIPSHDTFRSVLAAIKPKQFNEFFIKWTGGLCRKNGQEIIALDGKSLRGSRSKSKAVHIVNAWSSANGLTLGQLKTEDKSNEITAFPVLLEQLSIKDAVVTIDAMGTQKAVAETIEQAGGQYVLCLKENHSELWREVTEYMDDPEFSKGMSTHETTDGDHGRVEVRRHWISDQIDWLASKSEWAGLTSLAKVQRTRFMPDGTSSEENAYYLCSIAADAELFARCARAHWGVENSLHWVLDVTFNEDACQVKEKQAAENLSLLRKMALNLLKKEPSKGSMKLKRKKAAWDVAFLDAIFNPETHA